MTTYQDDSHWQRRDTTDRCRILGRVAGEIASEKRQLILACHSDQRTEPAQTIASELFPLCAALKWIARHGAKTLRPTSHGMVGRPAWLFGVHSTVERVPHGTVLVLGAWNYPLLLPGVQAAQALAGGNRVWIKPAPGCESATSALASAFHRAGVPDDALAVLPSSTDAAIDAMRRGVDLVVLTGAASTGRKVMAMAAQSLTPTIMELSGCDGVVVMAGADIDRAADAIVFGLTFNGGATCIGPRRLVATDDVADKIIQALGTRLNDRGQFIVHPSARAVAADVIKSAIDGGAIVSVGKFDADELRRSGRMTPLVLDRVEPSNQIANSDLFAPVTSVIRVASIGDAVGVINDCRYRLAASVFGDAASASAMAAKLSVGSVCINDLIVPTADPRVPFGGRGESGFGVTRGREGLLAMTTAKVVSRRRGRFAPHLKPATPSDAKILATALSVMHGRTWKDRVAAIRDFRREPEQNDGQT